MVVQKWLWSHMEMYESFSCSTYLSKLDIISFLNVGYSYGYPLMSLYSLYFISLVIKKKCWPSFHMLIYILSWIVYSKILLLKTVVCFVLLLLSSKSYYKYIVSCVCYKHFLLTYSSSFYFLNSKLKNWMFCLWWTPVDHLRLFVFWKSLPTYKLQRLSLIFSSRSFIILPFVFRSFLLL